MENEKKENKTKAVETKMWTKKKHKRKQGSDFNIYIEVHSDNDAFEA